MWYVLALIGVGCVISGIAVARALSGYPGMGDGAETNESESLRAEVAALRRLVLQNHADATEGTREVNQAVKGVRRDTGVVQRRLSLVEEGLQGLRWHLEQEQRADESVGDVTSPTWGPPVDH